MSWGTWWEPLGNLMGAYFQHIGNQKIKKISLPPKKTQRKKLSPLECMLSFLIGYMKFLFPKLFVTIFKPAELISPFINHGHLLILWLEELSRGPSGIYVTQHLPMHHPFVNQLWLGCASSNHNWVMKVQPWWPSPLDHPTVFSNIFEVGEVAIIQKRT